MSNAHLDAVFDNWKAMEDVSFRLRRLASSFDDTGNKHVADKLWAVAEEIITWAERVRDTHSEKLSEDLAQSRETTANIMTALVAGLELAEKNK